MPKARPPKRPRNAPCQSPFPPATTWHMSARNAAARESAIRMMCTIWGRAVAQMSRSDPMHAASMTAR